MEAYKSVHYSLLAAKASMVMQWIYSYSGICGSSSKSWTSLTK